MNEHVAVVIVGFRCPEEIRRCVEALARSSHAGFEVHVCENGGPDSYRGLVSEFAATEMVSAPLPEASRSSRVLQTHRCTLRAGGQAVSLHEVEGNVGYAGGINVGYDVIRNDKGWSALWVLNPDTQVHEDAMAALVAYAADERYGILGCRLILKESGTVQLYGGRWRRWMARGFNIGLGEPQDAKPDVAAVEAAMDYVSGASMYVPRRYFDAVGEMDERYFLYNEEIDWCLRRGALRLGYVHDAIVYHEHGATMGSSHDKRQRSPLSVYLDERNKLLFSRRFFPREYPAIALTTLALTGQYLASGAVRNFGYAIAGWIAGLAGREGAPEGFPFKKPALRGRDATDEVEEARSSAAG
jgi:GT2 family glycosyltransferase